MPSPLDLADLPFLREALVEVVLLAAAGGLLSAWIVLRRLAFFTHAVGSATFPGLVVADASGGQPAARGDGRGARLRRRRRARRPRRPRAERGDRAAAGGGARRRGRARQRRVRVGRRGGPAAVRHAARPRDGRPRSRPRRRWRWSPWHRWRSGAPGRRSRSTPTARPRWACRRRAPTSSCWRWWRSPRWRRSPPSAPCWWPRSTCCRAPRRGWSRARSRRCWPGRWRSRSRRALLGLYGAYWLDLPPGPPVAVLGALTYAVIALATGVRGARLGAASA